MVGSVRWSQQTACVRRREEALDMGLCFCDLISPQHCNHLFIWNCSERTGLGNWEYLWVICFPVVNYQKNQLQVCSYCLQRDYCDVWERLFLFLDPWRQKGTQMVAAGNTEVCLTHEGLAAMLMCLTGFSAALGGFSNQKWILKWFQTTDLFCHLN